MDDGAIDDMAGKVLFNPATKCLHIAESDERLRCGRPYPKKYLHVDLLPADARRCPRSF